ncbi:MAG: Cna B-type domain-containing protein, partial [Lachnospiraceae bacterium]|nr:Cna B-type domain-containing protein [Lachnospiraceae bacterium]
KDVKEIEFEADKQDEIVSVVITNLHETHKETITASKIWEDEENKYNTRPKKTFGDYHTYFMLLYKLDDTPTAKWAPVRHYSADFEKNGCQYPDHHIYTTSPVIQEVSGSEIEEWKNVAIWENVSTKGVDDTVDDYALAAEYDKNVSFMVIEVPDSDYHFPDFNSDVEPKSIAPYGYKASKPVTFDPEVEKVKEEHADVTNTLITTSLGVEKFWEDENDKYKTRPEKIQVKLERKLAVNPSDSDNMWNSVDQLGEEDTIIEIDGTNNWTGSFDGLPSCDKYGNEYVYRAVETALIYAGNKSVALNVKSELDDGKTLTAEGGNYNSRMENSTSANPSDPHKFKLVLTNSLKDEGTTSLTVTKEWKDENDRDRLRPGHIQLNLIRDDVKVDTKTISGPSWEECKWDNLPLYKNGYTGILGERSEYTVTEEPVADYEPKIVKSADKLSVTLTNTHVPKKAVIVADKIWTDSGNTYSTRPKEIYLRLLYKYAGEGDSQYRIVPEYSEAEFVKDGMYTSENADGVFTTSKATQKCTGRDDEDWMNAARWENLPLKAKPNSSEYEPMTVMYKVIEVNSLDTDAEVNTSEASAGYEVLDTTIDGNSLNTDVDNNISITNRLVITEFNIKKVFEDEDNKYNTRPDSIDVQILRRIKTSGDGEWKPVKVKGGLLGKDLIVNLTKSEAYSKKLTDLPKYDKDRNEYEYSCLEKDLIFGDKKVSVDNSNIEASYKISGSDAEIKNTLITTSLTVTKIWDDNSNARGARPKKIVFNVEQKETRDIASQIISTLTELFTGKDGYSELKMLKGGKEETVEIVIEGPEFNAYTLEGLPAYSEDGYLYSYRAVETKLVYEDREVMVENETSLYEKPTYQLEAIESDKDSKGNKTYKYNEKVVNKIIPIRHNPGKPKPEDSSPITPVIVNPVPEKPTPKYELVEDTDPEELPQKLTEIIDELIDLPEGEVRKEKITKLYRDIVKIIQEDPAFIDKLDEETADIVIRFLRTGVLGRRRSKLPKTGGVVGSVMALLFASMLIGLGVAIRPDGGSDKKKRHKSGRKA